MIPGILTVSFLLGSPGCGSEPPPTTERRSARSDGPPFDPVLLESDPEVLAFQTEAARFLELSLEIAPLETALGEGSISTEDTERWRNLTSERARERGRLNNLLYAETVTPEQRAAMWWILRGAVGLTSPTDGT